MYQVYCDGNLLYDLRLKDTQLDSPALEMEINKSGSFNFGIYPSHPMYSKIKKMSSCISVKKDGKKIFECRPYSEELMFDRELKYSCEGCFGYFNDTIVRPFSFKGDVLDFVKQIIEQHNSQVEESKQFKVGTVSVKDPNNYISRSNTTYETTMKILNTRLLDILGGYFVVRYEDDGNYLDYLEDFNYTLNQKVVFGENLLDVSKIETGDDLITALIPLGAKIKNSEGEETDERVTISSVNDGKDYLYNEEAVKKYGWIFGKNEWDDVTLPENLKTKGQELLDERANIIASITISAVDLSLINKTMDDFFVGRYVICNSKKHGLNGSRFLIRNTSIVLNDPSSGTLTAGKDVKTLSDSANDTNVKIDEIINITNKINGDYVTQEDIDNAASVIIGAKGGSKLDVFDGEKTIGTMYLDTDNIDTAKNILYINHTGIAFSNNGKDGPWTQAIGIDGSLYNKWVNTWTLSANIVQTGILQSKDQETFFLDLDNGILKMNASSLTVSGNTIENIAQDAGKNAALKELEDFTDTITSEIGNLQNQIDGQVQTWFDDYVPTEYNAPANSWISTTDKNNHLGDLFYIVDNPESGGRAYRWALVNGSYKWILIEDEDVAKALADAAKAQDTADGKRRVFVSQPVPPYDVGDLWTQGPNGDLMCCRFSRQSGYYNSSDWEKASKYTDNTELNNFISGEYADTIKDLGNQLDGKAETWYQSNDPSYSWSDELQHKGDIWFNTGTQKSYRWDGYSWEEFKTNPPDKVFDQIDGKAQIFVVRPTPPYNVGDLWIKTDKSLWRCNTKRETGSFYSGDWEVATKYIDSDEAGNIAQGAVDGMTQDDVFNKLTNNGETQGFYIQDGKLYINAEYVKIINLITDHLLSYGENYSLESKNGQIYLYHGDYSRMRLALYYLKGDEFNYDSTFGNIQIWKGKVDKSGNLLDDNARYTYLTAESFMLGSKKDGTYLLNISNDGVIHGKNRTWIENSTGRWVFAASDGSTYNGVEALKEQSDGKRMVFRGTVGGTCYLGTTSMRWNTGFFTNTITQSDLKDKENIREIPNAKAFIMALKPIAYTLKDGDSGRVHMGFGAQEVAQAAAQNNMGDLALYQAGVIDENGEESYYRAGIPDEKLSWGLNYHEFIAPLVQVIQEQERRIQTLEEKIKNLEK